MSESFGSRIKKLRSEKNMNQATLAAKIGISQPHLGRLETEQNEPSLNIAIALARELNVSLLELIGLTETKRPEFIEEFARWLEDEQVTRREATGIRALAMAYLLGLREHETKGFRNLARDVIVGFHPSARNWNGIIYSDVKTFLLPAGGSYDTPQAIQGQKEKSDYYVHIEVAPIAMQLDRDISNTRTHHIVILNSLGSKQLPGEVLPLLAEQILLQFKSAVNFDNTFWYAGIVGSNGLEFAQIYDLDYLRGSRTTEIKILGTGTLQFAKPKKSQQQPPNLSEIREAVNEAREDLPNQDQINMGEQVGNSLVANNGQIDTNQENTNLPETGGQSPVEKPPTPRRGLLPFPINSSYKKVE
jgi:XRE family transcriptional regulator, regulator of sulfur utilization